MDYIKVKFNQNANTLPHANKKFVVTPNRLILYNLKQKKSKTFIPNNPSWRHVHKKSNFRYWVYTTIMPKYRGAWESANQDGELKCPKS
jgi:hypothetical protein